MQTDATTAQQTATMQVGSVTAEPAAFTHRKTKITGTLGPASRGRLAELFDAGLDVVRLNFSHIADPAEYTDVVREIRDVSLAKRRAVAIIGDLSGPKIRCNDFAPEPTIKLVNGSKVELRFSTQSGSPGVITTSVVGIVEVLDVGHRVLLDDGNMVISVTERKSPDVVVCTVVNGGILKSHKGINVPDVRVNIPALTEKDRRDAKFLWDQRVDYVAMSFVQHPQDVHDLLDYFTQLRKTNPLSYEADKQFIKNVDKRDYDVAAWRPKIILKIEKPQALEHIDELIALADGIMVARGDLAVELSFEQVPLAQKEIIRKCNIANKPVITATQMLESMIHNPVPTRAEVSDVANAVFDGTDSVMLSAEMATGDFPVETVRRMAEICQVAEGGSPHMHPPSISSKERQTKPLQSRPFARAVAEATTLAACEAGVTAIVAFSATGVIARLLSKKRPSCPIIAMTSNVLAWRQMTLLGGVIPVLTDATAAPSNSSQEAQSTDVVQKVAHDHLDTSGVAKRAGIKTGDAIILCAGQWKSRPALSNMIKLMHF